MIDQNMKKIKTSIVLTPKALSLLRDLSIAVPMSMSQYMESLIRAVGKRKGIKP